jgi:asparagine synthetase B (glutamine-hydrolysing)
LKALEEEMVERLRAAGHLADGRRRAARRLPLGRRRQLGGRRLHGRGKPQCGRDLLDRLRRGRPRRDQHAAKVAELFATHHRSRTVAAADFSLIDRLADSFDEPFADASALATFRVCELAREKVKVSLSGDGADEALAGYRRYRMFMAEERARRWLPDPLRRAAGRIGDLYPKLDWAPQFLRAKTSLQALGQGSGAAYAAAVGVTPPRIRSMLYTSSFINQLAGHVAEERYVRAYEQAPATDSLSRAQYADLKIWLPGDILTKVDRTSMAVSLEAPRTAARPPPRRVCRPVAGANAAARRRGQVADETGAGRPASRRDPPSSQDGLRHAR